MAHNIGAGIEGFGLGQYADVFGENEIDLDALPCITEDDLKDIVVVLGARRKLFAAIVALTSGGAEAASVSSASATQTVSVLSGEQRQITVLFAVLAGVIQLSGDLGAEATHALHNTPSKLWTPSSKAVAAASTNSNATARSNRNT